jgi:hypothetical protein
MNNELLEVGILSENRPYTPIISIRGERDRAIRLRCCANFLSNFNVLWHMIRRCVLATLERRGYIHHFGRILPIIKRSRNEVFGSSAQKGIFESFTFDFQRAVKIYLH